MKPVCREQTTFSVEKGAAARVFDPGGVSSFGGTCDPVIVLPGTPVLRLSHELRLDSR